MKSAKKIDQVAESHPILELYETLTRDLLEWFDREQRDLPWRQNRDPYSILVSEIMLQQTRVEVVVDRFQRFLDRFPTVIDLARATSDEVLEEWSGLGYYSRAKRLHQSAQTIAQAQRFPDTAKALIELPGIGEYTSAAIASQAFGERVAVLDGNVERLLCRFLAESSDPKKATVRRKLSKVAQQLLDPERPGDSNQALMELGATVCKPRSVACNQCPLHSACRGHKLDPLSFGKPKPKRATECWGLLFAIVEREGRLLLVRRGSNKNYLAGTWEPPGFEWQADGDQLPAQPPSDWSQTMAQAFPGCWKAESEPVSFRHAITHRRFRGFALRANWQRNSDGQLVCDGSAINWFTAREIERLPLSSRVMKALDSLQQTEAGRQRSLSFRKLSESSRSPRKRTH